MTKDNKWIEVLSGKKTPDTNSLDELEAAHLRNAIRNHEKDIGLDKITSENSYFRFKQLKDSKKYKGSKQKDNKFYFKLLAYVKNKIQAIKLIFVFILGICASLLIPILTINTPMQVANNDHNSVGIEQALKENKKDFNSIDELKNINPRIEVLTSHSKISVNDYLQLSKIHSRRSEDYLDKYIGLAFNNFVDYGALLKAQQKKPLLCFVGGRIYTTDKLRALIDQEINQNSKIDLNQRIEIILLHKLSKENPCD